MLVNLTIQYLSILWSSSPFAEANTDFSLLSIMTYKFIKDNGYYTLRQLGLSGNFLKF